IEEKISINYKTGIFSIGGENFQLAQKFIKYNTKQHMTEEKSLKMLENSVGRKEEFKRLFLGLLGPRISQEQFICPKISCRFTENADLVGASNIADRGIEQVQKYLIKS